MTRPNNLIATHSFDTDCPLARLHDEKAKSFTHSGAGLCHRVMQETSGTHRKGLQGGESKVSVGTFGHSPLHLPLTLLGRDVEFDLENDKYRCLNGLFVKPGEAFSPSDVLRTTKIFKNAEFFANGTPDSTQVVQGCIGDCWFLSALSAVATAPGLLEQLCVAVSVCLLRNLYSCLGGNSVTKAWASMVSSSSAITAGLMSSSTSEPPLSSSNTLVWC